LSGSGKKIFPWQGVHNLLLPGISERTGGKLQCSWRKYAMPSTVDNEPFQLRYSFNFTLSAFTHQ